MAAIIRDVVIFEVHIEVVRRTLIEGDDEELPLRIVLRSIGSCEVLSPQATFHKCPIREGSNIEVAVPGAPVREGINVRRPRAP